MKLQMLLVLFLRVAGVQPLREVSGYLGETVTLPSGANPSWKLSSIVWSIFSNNTWIATYWTGKKNVNRVDRYKGRLGLNTSTGDLTIHRLTAEDDMEYTVDLTSIDAQYSGNKSKVTVRQHLQKPSIRRFLAKNETCSWFLQCSSADTDVALSWQVVPPSGTFSNLTIPDGSATALSAFLLATPNRVEITCISRRDTEKASQVCTLKCDGEEPETRPTPDPRPRTHSWSRERYVFAFLLGSMLGVLVTVTSKCAVRRICVKKFRDST
ncbi:T-lymphocyte surface antigen Ly-9 [Clinocottus analis]|uniref:T-lymphocyte surface antigen Ly-9 n=1 Tax=Clinocottus analis TaxID=304258 RepID=UPI0035BF9B9A